MKNVRKRHESNQNWKNNTRISEILHEVNFFNLNIDNNIVISFLWTCMSLLEKEKCPNTSRTKKELKK